MRSMYNNPLLFIGTINPPAPSIIKLPFTVGKSIFSMLISTPSIIAAAWGEMGLLNLKASGSIEILSEHNFLILMESDDSKSPA